MSKGNNKEYEKLSIYTMATSWVILAVNLYYYAFPLFSKYGLTHKIAMNIMLDLRGAGIFDAPYITKSVATLLMMLGGLLRTGKSTTKGWIHVLVLLGLGIPLYIIRPMVPATVFSSELYIFTTLTGYTLISIGFFYLSRKFKKEIKEDNMEDSFDQCRTLVKNEYSINLETRFKYQGKMHRGYINIINPFRATMIMGTPGAGKSYSVIEPVIEQATAKGYSMFVYDYKYDSLSRIVYNELKDHIDSYKVPPKFGVINFKDPRYSNRCNPLRPEYITDPADTTEIAELVMQNVNKAAVEKEDFFSMSAKVYLDALLWFLKIYKPEGKEEGTYCSFPHVIELMGCDYKKVFEILRSYPSLEVKLTPFINALEGGAQDQLQGQIASAQIPLNKFISPALYWVLSANEINLDINNPESPMVLCMGNDPERQSIYSTTLALFTAQMFKIINKKGKLHSAVILDELPTVFLKGLDNLIATARSNKVAIFMGVQDKSQIKRDYGDKESTVILNTVGNKLCGQVSGETAKEFSQAFGKQKRKSQSHSQGEDNESVSTSYHEEEILPVNKIETMSQGEFFGIVADNNDQKIDKKLFCGEIQRPQYGELMKERERKGWTDIPMINDFGKEYIEEEIEENFDSYLKAYCAVTYRKRVDHPELISEARTQEETDKMFDDIKKNEINLQRVKTEILEAEWKKKVTETVEENFKSIQNEIKEMVEMEYAKVIERKSEQTRKLKEKKVDNLLDHHRDLMLERNARARRQPRETDEE